jgi:LuxR family maltose regulon positive regulatory protein
MPPRLRSSVILRESLLARLDTGLGKKLTLVTAPTGFGKTTLVSMWLARRDIASAWITLDENDNDPIRFWTYIVTALRSVDSSIGKTTLASLNASTQQSFQTFLTPLINDLTKVGTPCVLVLEDYHSIASSEIHDGLSFLIQNLPELLHLVLVTRVNPGLPLHLLRARDELIEIDMNDLRFNLQETRAFLQMKTSSQIPSSAITSLFQKTDGWIAGLQLAAASLQHRNTEDVQNLIRNFSGSHRYVSEYLIREVFENQPDTVQEFLLKTCFLKTLTPSLCDATTELSNSAAILELLERDQLFLSRLEEAGDQIWYRYNPLFAEFIQFLAMQRFDESALQRLFERAGDWYEYHGLLDEAIESALHARLFARAMMLIEKYIEIHDLRELRTLVRWLDLVPQQDILQRPVICFIFAQVMLYAGDRFAPATALKLEPFLNAAESHWRAPENHSLLGQLLSFRGNVAWWQGDFPKAFEYSRQSLGELLEQDVFWRGNSLLILSYEALNEGRILDAQDLILEARALLGAVQNIYGVLAALQLLSDVFYLQGNFEQAEQLDQQILVDAVGDESMLDDQGMASLGLANVAYERNELEQAEQFARRALDFGIQRGNELLQVQATNRLAEIWVAKDDLPGARELVKSLETNIQNPTLLRELQATSILISIRANDISSTDWWVKIVSAESKHVLLMQKEREALILARLRIAEGKSKEALDSLSPWERDSSANGRVQRQIEALVLEALAHHADSNLPEATALLIQSLSLGQAKGYRRIYLDEGTRMATLLQAALPSLPNRTLSLFATTLLHSFPAESTVYLTAARSTVQIEALSQQELRVLRLLVAGLSNADIARELVVSNNTIKTHVKSIYRKLNISSRDEARVVARELKLL